MCLFSNNLFSSLGEGGGWGGWGDTQESQEIIIWSEYKGRLLSEVQTLSIYIPSIENGTLSQFLLDLFEIF